MWHVYILETDDNRFYTGSTNNLALRLKKHQQGKGAKFTRNFGCKALLYSEDFETKSEALKREKAIQSMSRQEKEILINR